MSLQAGNLQLAVQGNGIFSPNGDGNQDTLTFETTVMEPEGLDTWDMQIVSAEDPDDLVRRFSGTGSVPETITFDGENRRGRATADGTYRAQLSAQYVNGNIVESEPVEFRIDTQAPQARVQARTAPENTKPGAPFVFGGTDKPRVEFDVTLTEGEDWTAVVETPEDSMRGTLARYGFTGPEFSYTWNGTGPEGNEMPDGVYNLTLRARDEAGNLGTSNTVRVRKFTRDTPIGLEIDGDLVRANAGEENRTVTIRPQFEVAELIDEFLLEIKNDDGFVVRSLYKSAPFESFEWDGQNNAGDVLEEGNYTVDFQVIYYHGNKPEVSSRGPIALKRGPTEEPTTPPDVRLAAEPVPFSPDGDGYQDTVQFELEANSTDPVQSWELAIVDPAGNLFRTFSGEGDPPQFIRWNGRAEDGELVQAASDYTAELTVTDENDLSDSAETRVTTDVLVFRDDQGRLLINVPSIHFAGFSADLFEVERSKLEQNLTTLRRLSEILQRFPEYGITVEGHAAHIFFEEGRQKRIEQEEVLLPLSQNRAQEVKEALIILGVERDRMETRGVGGRNPVVPHSNREELWKNRRVVFILEAEDRGE
jgi:outer membrane protein OmpA-like peptidoglycan-associated protein